MAKKRKMPAEIMYLIGLLIMSFGNGMMAMADLGVSMVVAPAKVLADKTGVSFGMAGILVETVLLAVLCLVMRKFRLGYLFSFLTVFFYGCILDLWLIPLGFLPMGTLWLRILWTLIGMVITSFGVACFFHTYLAPEVYDLFVREVSEQFRIPLGKFKTAYDCASLALAVILTFALFGTQIFSDWSVGNFSGIGPATIFCALVNGTMISFFSRQMQEKVDFFNLLPLERYFK